MPTTTIVTYKDADGSIIMARYADSANLPVPPAGEACLDMGLIVALPSPKNQKVDIGQTPPVVIDRPQSEIDDENNAILKTALREQISNLEVSKDKYAAHSWSTTDIDTKIAALIVEHDAIP